MSDFTLTAYVDQPFAEVLARALTGEEVGTDAA